MNFFVNGSLGFKPLRGNSNSKDKKKPKSEIRMNAKANKEY